MSYIVSVYYPGTGRFRGGHKVDTHLFKDERKARDYYTDMLIRYPDYNVEFINTNNNEKAETTNKH